MNFLTLYAVNLNMRDPLSDNETYNLIIDGNSSPFSSQPFFHNCLFNGMLQLLKYLTMVHRKI